MSDKRSSLKPIKGAKRALRRRLHLKGELVLAFLPTATILIVLGFVEVLSKQRLLFASLAASAFLIYLDPQHGTNSIRTLVMSQIFAATVGFITFTIFGSGYLSMGSAMIIVILFMILLDAVHPPAVATSLSFALKSDNENNLVLFSLAVGITAWLIVLERFTLWLLASYNRR
ncbi:HPP family protein [Aerosakkonemataceae cyanobacterium BLCC-F154]|uniref:HPP family protein n=1 Tax=Floridaenema fluviatile BLCC-F154 TaxID=3153640 RepID=A0ABV4YJJ5_9CYAN